MAEAPIPVYTNLEDLYANLGTSLNHAERWNHLAEEFESRFGKKPEYIARAPGRVNLIGEHIDYCLFGVCPAAVERDILIACASREVLPNSPTEEGMPGGVVAENIHPKYRRQTFAPGFKPSKTSEDEDVHAWHLDINTKELRWESYVKAGYYGVLNNYFTDPALHPVPVDILVTGTVPAGSGLSSSAAMVVASTLAFLAVNGKLDKPVSSTEHRPLTKGELTNMAVDNEKRVGVNSGGMDQAASVISDPSSALYISFFPKLHAAPISLPKGAVFVCANSLVVSDKAVSAKWQYNLRVVETLVAARVLAKHLGVSLDAGGKREKITLREVVGRLAGENPGEAELRTEELAKILERMDGELEVLKPTGPSDASGLGVTMEEMISKTGLSKEEFDDLFLSWVEVEATHFHLYKRAKHVFSEALRVLKFRDACLTGDASSTALIKDLAKLMNESQTSCAELYECTCPEIDELTKLAREAGAYGSRVTGAGWGGCTVSLVAEDNVEAFIQKVASTYGPYKDLKGDALNDAIFATKPSSGACVYKV
ncbi:Galactokinase [Flagelloscypha sp. PMI_526]|nr:Galactokinase [Flagelloscypha sp. PMI_526]